MIEDIIPAAGLLIAAAILIWAEFSGSGEIDPDASDLDDLRGKNDGRDN